MGDDREERTIVQGEQDEAKIKSSCSVWSIAIFLILILFLSIFGLYLAKAKNISGTGYNWKFWQTTTPAEDSSKSLMSEVSDSKNGEVLSIKIAETDLSELLKFSDSNFPVKNPSLKIQSDKIVLSGKSGSSILAMNVEIGLVPKAKDGKLIFEISEMKTAGVPTPQKITESVSKSLEPYLTIDSLSDIDITDVKLNESEFVITGIKK